MTYVHRRQERHAPVEVIAKSQPVLYLASGPKTAIAEVRAWRHAAVAVAEVKLIESVQIVNLLQYQSLKSPFFEEYLEWRLQLEGLFYRFADELSRPVMPNEEAILYKPSQYLCEIVKSNGYDGIVYPSGLGPDHNFILFNMSKAEVIQVSYVRVTGIEHQTAPIEPEEDLYEESPYDHLLNPHAEKTI